MKRTILFAFLAMATLAHAWTYPPASGISVSTNGHTVITGTTVQSVIDWLDDNVVLSTVGYVTETWMTANYGASSTNTFGELKVKSGTTGTTVTLGDFHGFVASVPNTFYVTNLATYATIATNTYVSTYNPQSTFSTNTGRFTPTMAGYYEVGAEATGVATNTFRIVSWDSNQIVNIGGTLATNLPVNGSGIVYADGTSTNYFYVESIYSGATSGTVSRLVFRAKYLGK